MPKRGDRFIITGNSSYDPYAGYSGEYEESIREPRHHFLIGEECIFLNEREDGNYFMQTATGTLNQIVSYKHVRPANITIHTNKEAASLLESDY